MIYGKKPREADEDMDKENKPIYVTQPFLPPLTEFSSYLEEIWRTGVMTHNGPLMCQLERDLSQYLGVPDTVCVANGTCAMQLALRALDLKGEIITTPFSYVATASIIRWEGCEPVFVDIDPETWNMDPAAIQDAITPRTVGIMPVHVFSAPCCIADIQALADRHHLRVIYDAAHAFGVNINGTSIMQYGDVSCTSFHATKIFNTCEGGACFTVNEDLSARLRRMRFFGFDRDKNVTDDGMNAKMTEISAGLGLVNLQYMDAVLKQRREKYELYTLLLKDRDYLQFQKINPSEYNYSYMPVLFDDEECLLDVMQKLEAERIYVRRYFHPALNNIALYEGGATPVAASVASRIACLPLYHTLENEAISRICSII